MSVDTLERLLITLSVRLHAFALCEVGTGWRLTFGPMEAVTIHYVLAGHGVMETGTGEAVPFGPRCIVIVPARTGHSLGEAGTDFQQVAAAGSATLVDDGLVRFTAGEGRDIVVVCGTISASYGGALGLFDKLLMPLVEDLSQSNIVGPAFQLLLEESARPTIGTQVLTEALMKQCLVLVLRQHLARLGTNSPLFAALADIRLARAVAAVLERPAAGHTVESLAGEAGMSRTAFAQRFSQIYGQSPIDFVRRVRLRHAAQLLATTALPVKVIASSVGYASRSYFTNAFHAAYGVDPKTYRATAGHAEVEPESVERAAGS